MSRSELACLLLCLVTLIAPLSFVQLSAYADQYEAPSTYYSTAMGSGATLMTQLRSIINVTTPVNYGNARYSALYTDTDPNVAGKIILVYDRVSVPATWDSGLTWNREHLWPQSRLGASANNDSANVASDQFNLRPSTPFVNGSHGNKPFGLDTTTGSWGAAGPIYWYPGDIEAGDVARAQFYMTTRYSQLTLTDAVPTGLQNGDLSSLVAYHFKDVPDEFERRRNHAIYGLAGENSPAITNPYRQSNRNPYVDHPEYVWSVFVDQQNDSQMYVGGAPSPDGSSALSLGLGSVIVGAAVPAAQNIALTKTGLDGTYYDVTASNGATSSVNGRFNAFPIITSGNSTKNIAIGLNTSTSTAGLKSGMVTINNLDITTAGGTGRGANDGNDTVNVSLNVLDHAKPSFSLLSDTSVLDFDFGSVLVGSTAPTFSFDIANLTNTAGFTADLELDSIFGSGDTSALLTDLTTFVGASALEAGLSNLFTATMLTSSSGAFSASYTLSFSDEDIPGASSLGSLTLNLSGLVMAVPEPSTLLLMSLCSVLMLNRRSV